MRLCVQGSIVDDNRPSQAQFSDTLQETVQTLTVRAVQYLMHSGSQLAAQRLFC